MKSLKTHLLGVRQEVMNVKDDYHRLKRKVVALKIVTDGMNENVSGGRVDQQGMHSDLKLVEDASLQKIVGVESLRTQVS